MPITTSAKKAIRASRRKRVFNLVRLNAMRQAIKEAKKAAGDKKASAASLAKAYQAIDKAAKRGVIKPNAAARKKSRLALAIKKIG